jgi:hypothetical protein
MTDRKRRSEMAVKKAKARKGQAYECGVCGYRVVVDEACGCAEEHVFICCDKPMKKGPAKKPAKKK